MEEWEYRCESCKLKGRTRYYWPLTAEFFDYRQGMNRCIACQREYRAAQQRKRRQNPEIRERDVQRVKEIRKVKSFVYNERLREKNARIKREKQMASVA